jgi:hypothetical protein
MGLHTARQMLKTGEFVSTKAKNSPFPQTNTFYMVSIPEVMSATSDFRRKNGVVQLCLRQLDTGV